VGVKPLRDYGYRQWLRYEGVCCACAKLASRPRHELLGLSDGAHTQNNGMRSKGPDSSCVPLCRKHHREYDRGREAFEGKYALDMKQEAAWWWEQYISWKKKTGVYEETVPF
jgi:hypothetical protein